jgi:hypothetical protein
MSGFDQISSDGIADAAFFAGLLTPSARLGLTPLPVRVYGIALYRNAKKKVCRKKK